MKALTICQPYAHLIVCGDKRVENRTWSTNYRGRLYIHAGKSRKWLTPDARANLLARCSVRAENLPFGAVVAVANLVDCVRMTEGRSVPVTALRQHPWLREHPHAHGPWCWILESVSPVGPWPYRGAQGLFNITDEALDAVANRVLGVQEP